MAETRPLRLAAKGISKRYGAVHALRGVNFELRAGEVMALLGENGAGKSTIVKVLSGLVNPDEGTIEIDGSPAHIHSAASSQMAGISVVQQEYSTVGSLSVAENLVLGQQGGKSWWSPRYLRRHAKDLLQRVGLTHIDAATPVEELSVAEMQLLEIARVLARDAKVVIFDEPTAALSDAEITTVLDVVRRLASEGRSIVYVTHRLNEVFQIADRVTIFRNGASEPALDAAHLDVDTVISKMLGRDIGELYPPRSEAVGDVGLEIEDLHPPGIGSPVSLSLKRGQILGVTGQLGSGASSFLQALAGVIPTTKGTVRINGSPLPLNSRHAGISAGVAYCSADRKKNGIFAGASIEKNLSSPWINRVATFGLISSAREKAQAKAIAAEFAINVDRLQAEVGTLSGGNQQKVAVGKWLGIGPQILLVDEPTRGVDVGARAEIYRKLRELCNAGLMIIVSSSDSNEIYGLCDVIGAFHRGKLVSLRPIAEWTEESLVREVMHERGAAA